MAGTIAPKSATPTMAAVQRPLPLELALSLLLDPFLTLGDRSVMALGLTPAVRSQRRAGLRRPVRALQDHRDASLRTPDRAPASRPQYPHRGPEIPSPAFGARVRVPSRSTTTAYDLRASPSLRPWGRGITSCAPADRCSPRSPDRCCSSPTVRWRRRDNSETVSSQCAPGRVAPRHRPSRSGH